MLTSIEIKNFKSIRSLSFELPKFAALVGPNGSGKTNIIQAMELFGEILARGTTDPVRELGWANILRRAKGPARGGILLGASLTYPTATTVRLKRGGRDPHSVQVDGISLTARLTIDHLADSDNIRVRAEELIAGSPESQLRIEHDDSGWTIEPGTDRNLWSLFSPPHEQSANRETFWTNEEDARAALHRLFVLPTLEDWSPEGNGEDVELTLLRILNRVRFEIPCIRYLAQSSQLDRFRLDASTLRSDAQARVTTSRLLGPGGEGLANAIDRLRGRGKEPSAAFRHVLKALQRVYPRIEDVRAQRIQPGRLTLLFRERGIEHDLGLANVSDGVLHALALLVMIEGGKEHRATSPLAIEEPENAIHPWSVRAMMARAQASSRQVLVTTHSETVVNAVLDPASLFIVENDDRKGTTVTPARQKERALDAILTETGQGLGDIWMDGTLGGVPVL